MKTKLLIKIKENNYTKNEKKEILNKYFTELTLHHVEEDFRKLRQSYKKLLKSKKNCRVGNKIVDYFTRVERKDTKGNKGISFFDYEYNKNLFLKQNKYLQDFIKKNKTKRGFNNSFKGAFDLYFGSISIFRPLIAMEIYLKFNPKSILDFTAGWGGRLIGAAVLNIPKYTGIELNKDLKAPYKKMINFLHNKSNTKIEMIFKDALQVDYSKLDYDLVLTSPPYYNTEIYKGTKKKLKIEWNEEFYKPLFKKTYKHLKVNGWYCLNIPVDLYEKVALPLLGKPSKELPLQKIKRGKLQNYKEMIYCWQKKKV